MSVLSVKAAAKVNLVLEVLGERSDGYHEVSTILQEVPEVFDTLTLKRATKTSLKCNDSAVPTDRNNTILIALDILQGMLKAKANYQITLEKAIPLYSGLGGAASDAAAFLKAVNEDLGIGLTRAQQLEILQKVSSDAAFFLEGGLQLATGRGEKLSTLPNLPPCEIRIIGTGVKISTKEAYQKLELPFPRDALKTYQVIEGLRELDIDKIAANLHNDFQPQTVKEHPEIQKALDKARAEGALASMLCGSGGAIFAIF